MTALITLDDTKDVQETNFVNWLATTGVRVGNIDIANFTNPIFSNYKLRGVKPTHDIKVNDKNDKISKNFRIVVVPSLHISFSHPFSLIFGLGWR